MYSVCPEVIQRRTIWKWPRITPIRAFHRGLKVIYNVQACFSLLGATFSESLTAAPAHVDKHIWPEGKVIMCVTFVVYVRSVESLEINLCLSLFCSSGRKIKMKHRKEYFVSGCLKQDKVPKNRVFHTLYLEKAFSLLRTHTRHFQAFWLSSSPVSVSYLRHWQPLLLELEFQLGNKIVVKATSASRFTQTS